MRVVVNVNVAFRTEAQRRIFAWSRSGALISLHTGMGNAWRRLASYHDAGAFKAPHLGTKPVQKSALTEARGFMRMMTTDFWVLRGGNLRARGFPEGLPFLNPLGLFNHGCNCWLDPPPPRESRQLLAAIRPYLLALGWLMVMFKAHLMV
jgi:hypothetical protein